METKKYTEECLDDKNNHSALNELKIIIAKNIKSMVKEVFEAVYRNITGETKPTARFEEDPILPQERFEPLEWANPIETQIQDLREILPDLQIDPEYLAKRLSESAPEHTIRVAVPKLDFLSKQNDLKDPYDNIGVLIEQVCAELDIQREGKFTHYRKNQLGVDRVQCIKAIAEKRRGYEKGINGDIMILDVDLGNTYAGWTPRRARAQSIIEPNHLALSSVDVAWILVLNPKRLQKNTDLSIDSVMEEYLSLDRGWVTVLFFYHRGGKLEFGYRWNRRQYFDAGTAIAKI